LSHIVGPRIIVALDYASAEDALAFVERVAPTQCKLKVGAQLFTVGGPVLVDSLVRRGFDVFLDLKFHDIPNTVAHACTAAARLGVWLLTVHTLGGLPMLRAAHAALEGFARRPRLVGVTLLTSHSQQDLENIGLRDTLAERVDALAALAHAAGLDGVVCSPWEAARLRGKFGAGFMLVIPGIRPGKVTHDDQARTMSPREAIAQGADYLVIGRPITQAQDPRATLAAINAEITAGAGTVQGG
jgi:orotidine-5'-phosphate decarboxylase